MKKSELLKLITENHASLEALADRILDVEKKRTRGPEYKKQIETLDYNLSMRIAGIEKTMNRMKDEFDNYILTTIVEMNAELSGQKVIIAALQQQTLAQKEINQYKPAISSTSEDSYPADTEVFKQFDDLSIVLVPRS